MSAIVDIIGREILDSRGNPTVECDVLFSEEPARWDAIQVDEFTLESMKKRTFSSVIEKQKTPLD